MLIRQSIRNSNASIREVTISSGTHLERLTFPEIIEYVGNTASGKKDHLWEAMSYELDLLTDSFKGNRRVLGDAVGSLAASA